MTVLDCDSARLALGALVLGALTPPEREQVERHAAECERCRAELAELAPLPGMLNLVRPDDVPAQEVDDLRPSPRLLDSLLAAAAADDSSVPDGHPQAASVARGSRGHGRHRGATRPPRRPDRSAPSSRRRSLLVGLGAVAAATVMAGVVWLVVALTGQPGDDAGNGRVTASATDPATAVAATVNLTPAGDGTDVAVTVSGVPLGQECDLVVVSTAGEEDVAAAWTASYGGPAEVTGHVRFAADVIDRLDVTTDDGVLLTVPLR